MQPTEEESRSEGNVGLRMYVKYFRAGANFLVLFILILLNALAHVSHFLKFIWCVFSFNFGKNTTHNLSHVTKLNDAINCLDKCLFVILIQFCCVCLSRLHLFYRTGGSLAGEILFLLHTLMKSQILANIESSRFSKPN